MTVSVAIWVANGREENEWDYVLSNQAPDSVYMLGPYEGTNNVLRDAPRAETFADLPSGRLVLLAPESSREFTPTISLLDYTHHEDAVYVFGPNNLHVTEEDTGGRMPDDVVFIPTDSADEMFNYSTYAITMWHRRHG